MTEHDKRTTALVLKRAAREATRNGHRWQADAFQRAAVALNRSAGAQAAARTRLNRYGTYGVPFGSDVPF